MTLCGTCPCCRENAAAVEAAAELARAKARGPLTYEEQRQANELGRHALSIYRPESLALRLGVDVTLEGGPGRGWILRLADGSLCVHPPHCVCRACHVARGGA